MLCIPKRHKDEKKKRVVNMNKLLLLDVKVHV